MTYKAFISTPLEVEQVARIRSAAKGRVDVIFDPELLPPTRYVADHKGIEGYERTGSIRDTWLKHLAEADFLWDIPPLAMLPSRSDMSWAPKAKWIQTTSSGVGPLIEMLKIGDTDCLVTNAKGIHAVPLSEFTMMALLAHVKNLAHLKSEQAQHKWERHCGESLYGKRVAIVGAGEVGHRVAELCKTFGMTVAAMSRSLTQAEGEKRGYDRVFTRAELADVLGESDAVVLCVPHTAATEKMIDEANLKAMKPGCVFVNIARGQVVDEPALIEALKTKHIGFAALDVAAVEPLPADSPLWDLPNVLISPHSASTVVRENELITDLFIHNMECMLNNTPEKMKNLFDTSRGY